VQAQRRGDSHSPVAPRCPTGSSAATVPGSSPAVYVAVAAEADGHEPDGVHKATLCTCLRRPALCTHRLLGELRGGAARHHHHRDG
jgi:hypothetical protein